jgi:tetratricopeptide (TPR) repeat protein
MTMLIIPANYGMLRGVLGGGGTGGGLAGAVDAATRLMTPVSRWEYLLTQFRVIVTYLRLLALPVGQNLDYDYPVERTFFHLPVMLSFLLLAGIAVLGWYLIRRSSRGERGLRLAGFGILWFFLTLSVESSIVPIADVIFEHRVYLPSAGMFLAAGAGFGLLREHLAGRGASVRKAASIAGWCVVLALAAAAYARNEVWRDELTLWRDVVAKSPGKARAYQSLGNAYLKRGALDMAAVTLEQASVLDPLSAEIYNLRGHLAVEQDRLDLAEELFRKAITVLPEYAEAYNNLGTVYSKRGLYDRAAELYTRTISLDPRFVKSYQNRGLDQLASGRPQQAIEDFSQALALKPSYEQALIGRASAYIAQRQWEDAIADLTRALMLRPDDSIARTNRCYARYQAGDVQQAAQDCDLAVLNAPDLCEAHVNRGLVLKRQGQRKAASEEFRRACALGCSDGCEAAASEQ